jgi:glycosyltransferase involved in cell wall biosynthesis
MFYSIIVPVYNRPDEVAELLESLAAQSYRDFEVLLVEDGSTLPCDNIAAQYSDTLRLTYYQKPNTGRSDTRNYGMQRARGDYFIFFDSDCIIPPQYFATLDDNLRRDFADCFGGPDAAHASFSDVQKAINYSMTSFFTTGGIRGGKQQMEKFKPRTFNMGFSREVFEKVGGFKNMFGEDIDLSIRISDAGFRTMLYRDAFVYHKRRVSFKKFFKQIRNFGVARINLAILHKGSLKVVHIVPSFFLLGGAGIILLAILHNPYWLLFPAFYTLLLFADAAAKTKKATVAALAVWAAYIQIVAYGGGFLTSFVQKIIFRKGMEDGGTLAKMYK